MTLEEDTARFGALVDQLVWYLPMGVGCIAPQTRSWGANIIGNFLRAEARSNPADEAPEPQ